MKINRVKKQYLPLIIGALIFCLYIDINLLAITLTYTLSLAALFLVGKKIADPSVYVFYSWFVKWAMFVAFTAFAVINLTPIYFYAMFVFIVVNIFLSPALEVKQS